MSGFLGRLAERALGVEAAARPVVPSFFAEWRTGAPGGEPVGRPDGDGLEPRVTEEAGRVAPGAEPGRVPATLLRTADPPPVIDVPAAVEPARSRPTAVGRPEEMTLVADAGTRSGPASRAEPAPMRTHTEEPRPYLPASTLGPLAVVEPHRAVPVLPAMAVGERAAPPRRDRTIRSRPVEPDDFRAPSTPERTSNRARLTLLAPASAPSTTIERVSPSRRPAHGDAIPGPRFTGRMEPVHGAEDRVVEISIGRIEVRATSVESVQPRSMPVARPGLSLEAYLQRRTREARA